MKKTVIIITVVIFASVFSATVLGSENPCDGIDPSKVIQIDGTANPVQVHAEIVSAFQQYTNIENNEYYLLCFDFVNDIPAPVLNSSFILRFEQQAKPPIVKPIFISGIKLNQTGSITAPLLTINYPYARVILSDLEITNASKGLEALGTEVEIVNPTITGNGTDPCVHLYKTDGSTIQGGDISGCSEGILLDNVYNAFIGASDAQTYDQDKVSIHNNGVGIHLANGNGNRWPYNSIYENDSGLNPDDPWKDGIVIDNEANGGIVPPTAKKQTESDGVLVCEKNEEGTIVSRKIEFGNVSAEGVISLYKTHRDYEYQGKDYIVECEIGTGGVCTLGALPSWLSIPDNECGLADLEVVAIFTTAASSVYTEKLVFDGDSSVIMPESEIPIEAGLTETGDDSTVSSSEGGGTEAGLLGGGISGSAGGGQAMKCGGTLVPSATLNGPALLHSLVWMTLPLLPVIAIRRRRSR